MKIKRIYIGLCLSFIMALAFFIFFTCVKTAKADESIPTVTITITESMTVEEIRAALQAPMEEWFATDSEGILIVEGKKTNADAVLALTVRRYVTLIWKAEYRGNYGITKLESTADGIAGGTLISLIGIGTFEIAPSAVISISTTNEFACAINVLGTPIVVNGGEISSTAELRALGINRDWGGTANITVNDGLVSTTATGGSSENRSFSSALHVGISNIKIFGGTVKSVASREFGEADAILNTQYGNTIITGGNVISDADICITVYTYYGNIFFHGGNLSANGVEFSTVLYSEADGRIIVSGGNISVSDATVSAKVYFGGYDSGYGIAVVYNGIVSADDFIATATDTVISVDKNIISDYSIDATDDGISTVWGDDTITYVWDLSEARPKIIITFASSDTFTLGFGKFLGAPVDSAPTVLSKTYNKIIVNAITTTFASDTVEYAISKNALTPGTWQDSLTFVGLDANTEYYIFARVKETETTTSGDWKVSSVTRTLEFSKNLGASIDSAPTVLSKTSNTIIVNIVTTAFASDTVEYAISKNTLTPGIWQDSPTFTGLDANTEYYVFARVKETETTLAGECKVSASILTDSANNGLSTLEIIGIVGGAVAVVLIGFLICRSVFSKRAAKGKKS